MSSEIKVETPCKPPSSYFVIRYEKKIEMGNHWIHEILMRKSVRHECLLTPFFVDCESDPEKIGFLTSLCFMNLADYFSEIETQKDFRIAPFQFLYTEHEKCWIVLEILRGVRFLQQKNLTHLKIKPENVLFQVSGSNIHCLISDFGLSCREMIHEKDMTFTPETFSCQTLSFQMLSSWDSIDIWNTSCLFWKILLDQKPVELIATHLLTLPVHLSEQEKNSFVLEWLYYIFSCPKEERPNFQKDLEKRNQERALQFGMRWPIPSCFDLKWDWSRVLFQFVEKNAPDWCQTFLVKQVFGFLIQMLHPSPSRRSRFWKEHIELFQLSVQKISGCVATLPLVHQEEKGETEIIQSQQEVDDILNQFLPPSTSSLPLHLHDSFKKDIQNLFLKHATTFDQMHLFICAKLVFVSRLEETLFQTLVNQHSMFKLLCEKLKSPKQKEKEEAITKTLLPFLSLG